MGIAQSKQKPVEKYDILSREEIQTYQALLFAKYKDDQDWLIRERVRVYIRKLNYSFKHQTLPFVCQVRREISFSKTDTQEGMSIVTSEDDFWDVNSTIDEYYQCEAWNQFVTKVQDTCDITILDNNIKTLRKDGYDRKYEIFSVVINSVK